MDDEVAKVAEEVARCLRTFGLNAVSWDSGGGMIGVGIAVGDSPPDELRYFFGTAAETWAGEVLDDVGEVETGLTTTVASSVTDAAQVAAGILQALADFASLQHA